MPKIKAVIFDLGNTLLYFNGNWNEAYKKADFALTSSLIQSGLDLDKPKFRSHFRSQLMAAHKQREIDLIEISTSDILKDSLSVFGFNEVEPQVIESALASLYAVSQEQWLIEEDCIPTLDQLKKRRYRMGLLSNAGDDVDLQTLVNKAKIRPYFDFVLSSEFIGFRKPNPIYFEAGLKYWKFKNEQIAMVGDTLNADILGANNLGIYSVWINRRSEIKIPPTEFTPDAIISTLSELPQILKDL